MVERGPLPSVVWMGIVCALAGSARAEIVVFANGLVHSVSDDSYASDSIQVEDPASGASPTTLDLIAGTIGLHYPQSEGEPPPVIWSVRARATHGARANVNVLGGATTGSIESLDASCTLVGGGTVGQDLGGRAVGADAGSGIDTAVLRVLSGSVQGRIESRDGGRVEVLGGSISDGASGISVLASGSARAAIANVTGGTVTGAVRAVAGGFVNLAAVSVGADTGGTSVGASAGGVVEVTSGVHQAGADASQGGRVEIAGGSFGTNGFSAISLQAISGGIARASGGSFLGAAAAAQAGQLGISGGTFGADFGGIGLSPSVAVLGNTGTSSANLTGGSFDGGVGASRGSSVRISGGSFGTVHSDPGAGMASSVQAQNPSGPGTAVVEIFGGSFDDGFEAGRNGTIHVYGTGLAKSGGMVTGTLQDGTPLALPYYELQNGQVLLHGPNQITSLPAGSIPLGFGSGFGFQSKLQLKLPVGLWPLEPDCQGGFQLAPPAAFELAKSGKIAFLIAEEARNPGEPGYQASVPIELTALELASVDPIDLGALDGTVQKLFVTLQSARGGPASTGTLTVDFAMQSFELGFEVFYDLREGGLAGPVVASGSDTIGTTAPAPWSPDPATGEFLPGIIAGGPSAFPLAGSDFSFDAQLPLASGSVPALPPGGVLALATLLAAAGLRRIPRP